MVPWKLWPVLFLLTVSAFASIRESARLRVEAVAPLQMREGLLRNNPVRDAQYADVPHTSARSQCEQTLPPEALTTPNPLFETADPSLKIKVSFIVGTDGRVHSPLILESSGTSDDHTILNTVRAWRYRPAMCNGVPTETEGKVEFSSR
ncbi:MAG: TonB family protein [Acidobacteria bacterium]|nr:TonB family protein [Acidobacteriota bacterium]